jgi:hypothetical protein
MSTSKSIAKSMSSLSQASRSLASTALYIRRAEAGRADGNGGTKLGTSRGILEVDWKLVPGRELEVVGLGDGVAILTCSIL